MPLLVWLYPIALLSNQTSATCEALAEAMETVSHHRLTRLLPAHGSGSTLLEHACRTRFVWEPGHLIHNDTVIRKPSATPLDRRHGSSPAKKSSDLPPWLPNYHGDVREVQELISYGDDL
jgi:hypothetical protein